MNKIALVTALALVAACGNTPEPKHPNAPPAGTGSMTTQNDPATGESGGKKIEGPVAPTNSDDVKQGIAALKAGDTNGAKAAFEVATQKRPKQADAWHYLGLVNDQTGNRADAEKDYRKALELQPDLEESATNLSAILVETGRDDEAIALMKKAIARNARNAALQVNLGMALSMKGDVDGASKAFDEALRIDPNSTITYVTYADHLFRAGKKDDAIGKLKQAEKLASQDAGVLASVALEYKAMKDFASCIAVLDKAVGLKDVAELRIYRGTCKLGRKDLSGATTEFKDAVAKEPQNAIAHYSLGNALADGGKLAEAVGEWETYLRLAPDGPQAKAAQKRIEIAKKKINK